MSYITAPKPMPMSHSDLLKEIHYNPDTGIFAWSYNRSGVAIDRLAGSATTRYSTVTFNRSQYQAHRIAWFYMTGDDPCAAQIDHIDRDKSNSVWSNLRLSTPSDQQFNVKLRSDNKVNVRGISPKFSRKGHIYGYTAYFQRKDVGKWREDFTTLSAAVVWRKNKEEEFGL